MSSTASWTSCRSRCSDLISASTWSIGSAEPVASVRIEQVVLGDDPVRQVELVEQQLQARLEPDPLEFELDRRRSILRPEPVERRAVEHDGGVEGPAELLGHLVERGRLGEREVEGLEQGVLDRARTGFGRSRASARGGPWARRSSPAEAASTSAASTRTDPSSVATWTPPSGSPRRLPRRRPHCNRGSSPRHRRATDPPGTERGVDLVGRREPELASGRAPGPPRPRPARRRAGRAIGLDDPGRPARVEQGRDQRRGERLARPVRVAGRVRPREGRDRRPARPPPRAS